MHKKYEIVKDHSNVANILIETGTYHGACISATLSHFKKIYSIELSESLAQQAKKKFSSSPHIDIIQGDSGVELSKIISMIDERIVFFIDAHYSMGSTAKGENDPPMLTELEQIKKHSIKDHVILIDDFNDYGRIKHYPSKESVYNALREINSEYRIEEVPIAAGRRSKSLLVATVNEKEIK